MDIEDIDVFIAPASARSEHRATAPTRAGRKALDKALPDDEARPRTLYDKPADTTKPADHGSPLVVVDQPATTRGPGSGGGPGHGHHRGLPARTVDAPHRRPGTGQRQDRCEGRSRHRRRRPHHAPTLRAISTSEEDTAALSMLSLVSTRTRPARSTRARAASGASRQALPTTRNQRRNYPQPLDTPHRPPETHAIPRAILNAPGEPTSTGGLARLVAIPPSSWSRVSDSNR